MRAHWSVVSGHQVSSAFHSPGRLLYQWPSAGQRGAHALWKKRSLVSEDLPAHLCLSAMEERRRYFTLSFSEGHGKMIRQERVERHRTRIRSRVLQIKRNKTHVINVVFRCQTTEKQYLLWKKKNFLLFRDHCCRFRLNHVSIGKLLNRTITLESGKIKMQKV